jgi:hypothetical protein
VSYCKISTVVGAPEENVKVRLVSDPVVVEVSTVFRNLDVSVMAEALLE